MKYVVHSAWRKVVFRAPPRLMSRPVFRWIWRTGSLLLLLLCWLGGLFAPAMVFSVPFSLGHTEASPSRFWIAAAVVSVPFCWMSFRAGCSAYSWLRHGVVFVEAFVAMAGLAFAVFAIFLVFSPG